MRGARRPPRAAVWTHRAGAVGAGGVAGVTVRVGSDPRGRGLPGAGVERARRADGGRPVQQPAAAWVLSLQLWHLLLLLLWVRRPGGVGCCCPRRHRQRHGAREVRGGRGHLRPAAARGPGVGLLRALQEGREWIWGPGRQGQPVHTRMWNSVQYRVCSDKNVPISCPRQTVRGEVRSTIMRLLASPKQQEFDQTDRGEEIPACVSHRSNSSQVSKPQMRSARHW